MELTEDMYEIKRFGDLEEGDVLLGTADHTRVRTAFDPHLPEDMYELENEKGESIKVSGNHLWYIETEVDLSCHGVRLREGRAAFKGLLPETVALLEEMADDSVVDLEVEATMAEMFTAAECDGLTPENRANALYRIGEAIGPITETIADSEEVGLGTRKIPGYNGVVFAQQILALMKPRKYKQWPVIVGRVITTRELAEYVDSGSIVNLKQAVQIH